MEIIPRDSGTDSVAAMLILADRHELRSRAEASCRECVLSAAAEGDLAGLILEDVQAIFDWSALVFDHGILSHPFVETRFGMYVADPVGHWFRGLRPIGHYRFITRLDGEVEDDYFILDEPRQA